MSVQTTPTRLKRIASKATGLTFEPTGEIRLRIRLRYCYVRHFSRGCEILPDSKYQSTILAGDFSTNETTRIQTAGHDALRIGLSGYGHATPARVDAEFSLGGAVNVSRQQDRIREVSTRRTPEVKRVQRVPSGWRIGDPGLGDPERFPNCLDGAYFDHPVETYPHTCLVEFSGDDMSANIMFAVTVRDGLHVERLNGDWRNKTRKMLRLPECVIALPPSP